jgi:hypothetical protein
VVSVTRTFALKGVQTIRRSRCNWFLFNFDSSLVFLAEGPYRSLAKDPCVVFMVCCYCNPTVFSRRRPWSEKGRSNGRGGGRKLHNEEFRNSRSSPSIIRMIKSRMLRWAGHVARIPTEYKHIVISEKARRKETASKPKTYGVG